MKKEIAVFAGGCFWCMESVFSYLDGVVDVKNGYSGGYLENPTYEQVSYGHSGHYEAVKIEFDALSISYKELLKTFWLNIDPTDNQGQFCDTGNQYKTAIFYLNEEQRCLAEKSKQIIEISNLFLKPITVKILKFEKFYVAEEYHQGYHKKCPMDYKQYYNLSGRISFFKKHRDKLKNVLDNLL